MTCSNDRALPRISFNTYTQLGQCLAAAAERHQPHLRRRTMCDHYQRHAMPPAESSRLQLCAIGSQRRPSIADNRVPIFFQRIALLDFNIDSFLPLPGLIMLTKHGWGLLAPLNFPPPRLSFADQHFLALHPPLFHFINQHGPRPSLPAAHTPHLLGAR